MSHAGIGKKFRTYDILDTKILDLVYNERITVMPIIIKQLSALAHRDTISKRVKLLNHERFFTIVEGCNPVCIAFNVKNEDNILEFIKRLKTKWRLI